MEFPWRPGNGSSTSDCESIATTKPHGQSPGALYNSYIFRVALLSGSLNPQNTQMVLVRSGDYLTWLTLLQCCVQCHLPLRHIEWPDCILECIIYQLRIHIKCTDYQVSAWSLAPMAQFVFMNSDDCWWDGGTKLITTFLFHSIQYPKRACRNSKLRHSIIHRYFFAG